jgi:hypothetical protein
MLDAYETKGTQSEIVETFVRFVGGTLAVTKVEGVGVTVAYTGTGIVTITWAENPGRFMGVTWGLQATTASGVKGYTVVPGVFSTTAFTLAINITSAAEALVDLAALQWCNLRVSFARNGA